MMGVIVYIWMPFPLDVSQRYSAAGLHGSVKSHAPLHKARFELTAKCDGADGYHPAPAATIKGKHSGERGMGFVLGFYGAAVLAFSLFVVVMITPRTRVEEKTVVEALKSDDPDRAVRLMLDL
jgi:hypothetical protein